MSLFWFCVCAYLLAAAVGLMEAEVVVPRGTPPLSLSLIVALFGFALSYPAVTAFHWIKGLTSRPDQLQ